MIKQFSAVLLLISICSAKELRIGVIGAYTVPHVDFGWAWESGAGAGLSVEFDLNRFIPAEFSVLYSHHDHISNPPENDKLIPSTKDVDLVQFNLNSSFSFPKDRRVQAIGIAGVTSTMFIVTNSWPPAPNSDESEIGFNAGTGITFAITKDLSLFAKYTYTFLLTEPSFITYSSIYSGVSYDILGNRNRCKVSDNE